MNSKYNNIKQVLIIRHGAIGDIVHSTATYRLIKKALINVDIDYLTDPINECLLINDPDINKVIKLDKKVYNNYKALFKLGKSLNKNNYDLVVNLQPSVKTNFLTFIINPKNSLIYKKIRFSKRKNETHTVNVFMNTLKPISLDIIMPDELKLYLSEKSIDWAINLLNKSFKTNLVAIIPGVSKQRENKLWPKEYWISLLKYLTITLNKRVIIIGGDLEVNIASEFEKINPDKIKSFCGQFSLSETASLMSQCNIVIGSDTGPTHIASTLGVNVIGLYGPTSHQKVGLIGKNNVNLISQFECLSCDLKKCNHSSLIDLYSPCMKAISVEQVIEQINNIESKITAFK
ncbi:MAG: glycosyltransferase family 9 protein [Cyanobacteriota bacterium]